MSKRFWRSTLVSSGLGGEPKAAEISRGVLRQNSDGLRRKMPKPFSINCAHGNLSVTGEGGFEQISDNAKITRCTTIHGEF